MQGIALAERFYREYGEILTGEYAPFVSAGLVGNGSECFGFDDELSRDHDFDAGFCLWVDDEAPEEAVRVLTERYEALPDSFMGVTRRAVSAGAERRKGVFLTSGFYRGLIGLGRAPASAAEWLAIPDYALAAATNGRVFTENATDFTYVRNRLLHGVPNDVLLKRLARALILAAQAGQYNYTRCVRHGETAAARLALSEFVLQSASAVYYLNRRFPPYYKWILRGLSSLPDGKEIAELLSSMLLETAYGVCADGIEEVAARLLGELKRRGLTFGRENYLEPHAYRVAGQIRDEALRQTHIMS